MVFIQYPWTKRLFCAPHAALLLKGKYRSSIHICWVCRMLKQRRGCYLQKGRTQIGRYRLQALICCRGWEDGEVDELGPCRWMEVRKEYLNGLGEHSSITPNWKKVQWKSRSVRTQPAAEWNAGKDDEDRRESRARPLGSLTHHSTS